jgi:hypothetical protein
MLPYCPVLTRSMNTERNTASRRLVACLVGRYAERSIYSLIVNLPTGLDNEQEKDDAGHAYDGKRN